MRSGGAQRDRVYLPIAVAVPVPEEHERVKTASVHLKNLGPAAPSSHMCAQVGYPHASKYVCSLQLVLNRNKNNQLDAEQHHCMHQPPATSCTNCRQMSYIMY